MVTDTTRESIKKALYTYVGKQGQGLQGNHGSERTHNLQHMRTLCVGAKLDCAQEANNLLADRAASSNTQLFIGESPTKREQQKVVRLTYKFFHTGVYFKILSPELNYIMFVNTGLKKHLPQKTLEHKLLSPSRLLYGCGCYCLSETGVYREWSST